MRCICRIISAIPAHYGSNSMFFLIEVNVVSVVFFAVVAQAVPAAAAHHHWFALLLAVPVPMPVSPPGYLGYTSATAARHTLRLHTAVKKNSSHPG